MIDLSHSAFGYVNAVIVSGTISDWACLLLFYSDQFSDYRPQTDFAILANSLLDIVSKRHQLNLQKQRC